MGARASAPADPTGAPPSPLRPKFRRVPATATAEQSGPRHVVVVVLGDVGRSPRMQYHAMSLASHGVRVTLVGYTGERCVSAVENSPRITSRRFDPPLSGPWGRRLKRRAYLIFAVAKALALLATLVYELAVRVDGPDAILVQNPPSLPGLACVYLACLVQRCSMVLDWHNLGFTMFDRGPRHPLVWITRRAESFFGRRARVNITVSHAMRDWIMKHFNVAEAHVVYDQPPDFFRPPTVRQRHALFKKLAESSPDFAAAVRAHTAASSRPSPAADATAAGSNSHDHPPNEAGPAPEKPGGNSANAGVRAAVGAAGAWVGGAGGGEGEERTLFTTRSAGGACRLRADRPALLVSSTSWTPDEDFSVLLEALRRFNSRAASGACPTLPFVVVVVTGKGPEKAKYVEKMRAARMERVAVCTAWLEPDDYPVLLGSADLGICLHTSTSGVDLPMKVVDMFGCGVPVCAVHFQCLKELVQDGYNGCVFKGSTELALQLEALLDGYPRGGCELGGYRTNVREVKRWDEHWDEFAWPLFWRLGSRLSCSESTSSSTRRHGSSRIRGGGGGGSGDRAGDILLSGRWSATSIVETFVVSVAIVLALLLTVPSLRGVAEEWVAGAEAVVDRLGGWAAEVRAAVDRQRRR